MRSWRSTRIRGATRRIIPPKTPRIIKYRAAEPPHTSLQPRAHTTRVVDPLAFLPSDPCTRFSAPTLLRLGPITAFAGIFVQPHMGVGKAPVCNLPLLYTTCP